ncbi:alpha/beta hydrolase [Exilibacterium tricleocarpae]|uniref:Alpha/beta hydrolase n=1 Tax=Exilibacterium tricleocarpae TaxID=2591008 RepID=A0A545U8F0_9GAMM|nr:alpha/beta hydrolase [Exilibacterium tricleocarpae]TQV85746.1 alpha/beta hydrolase [Exilibacterium tricleocarpae]
MKGFFITVLVGYVLLCLLLGLSQRRLLYFPQAAEPVRQAEGISFDNAGIMLRGWVLNPGRDRAVLYYGGNAENVEYNIDFFRAVLPEYSVYLIPYRGYGNSDGSPSEAGFYSDALYIHDQVRPRHTSVALIGRSLGSGVATYVAAERDVERVLLVSPFDSVENLAKQRFRIFPVGLLLVDKYRSYERARRIDAPVLVLIAENDQVVPRPRTDALLAAFTPEQQVEAVVIKNAGHNDISGFAQYSSQVRNFFSAAATLP